MNIITLILFVILFFVSIFLIKQKNDLNKRKIEIQKKEKDIYFQCSEEILKAKDQLNLVNSILEQRRQQFQNEKNEIKVRLQDFQQTKEEAMKNSLLLTQQQFENQKQLYYVKMDQLNNNINQATAQLQKLKDTQKAAYEAILKEKQAKAKVDDYRLLPSETELSDIQKLNKVRRELIKPRILSMLIWQTYWQPLAKTKFPIILKDKTKTGVYKITNIKTRQCYIGQSVDIYKRWNQHCKAGLGIDTPPGNKLYKAIQDYGLQNFTFEILLECNREQLNEKEKYFIELYQADTYGYNSTIGNK